MYGSGHSSYKRSTSPVFEEDQDTEHVANASDDSADTEEVEVSKTPPPQVLRSSTRARPKQLKTAVDDIAEDNSATKMKDKKKKRRSKSGNKGTGSTVKF